MKSGSTHLSTHLIAICGSVCSLSAGVDGATIVIDGVNDWVGAPPAMAAPALDDVGHIARWVNREGHYVWRDRAGDERTDFFNPDPRADIREARVTADTLNLYILVHMSDIATVSGPGAPQVQIAVDTDQVSGSGTDALGGLADTLVSNAARWERLLITRFGSGGNDVVVFDSGFVNPRPRGAAAISASSEIIELSVPWSELGVAPPARLRLTVAVFSAQTDDSAQDIGGAGVSDVLDCVTNYGDPGTPANTLSEVSDGRIDYFFDVFFESDGDAYAPLLISEVLPVPSAAQGVDPAGEYIEIYNASPAPIDLAGVKLSDEETVGGSEGTAAFPVSHVLPPGGVVTIARSGVAFTGAWGFPPDYEWLSVSAGVPDMASYTAWAGGVVNMNLSSSGDEVLILDGSDTVLDVVTWSAAGAWPGVIGTGTTVNFTVGASIDRFASVFDPCGLEDTNVWNADARQNLSPTPGAVSLTPSQAFSFATYAGGAPILWNQAHAPSRASLIGQGVTLNGAAFSAGLPTAASDDAGFPDQAAGGHTSNFNTALTLGRRTTLAIAPSTSRAVELPGGNDGTVSRHGIELSWACGRSLLNRLGPDLVVYESGGLPGVEGAEALMVSVRSTDTQIWTDWHFYSAASFQNFVGDASAGAYATVYDLTDLGIPPLGPIDGIRIANMMLADRIAGAGNGVAQGRVLPGDGGANSNLRPNPGPVGIADAGNGGSFGLGAFDPDPLMVAPLSAAAVVPTVKAWRSVRAHGGAGPQAMAMDPAAVGNGIGGPASESRLGGVQRIEVSFSAEATIADAGLISVIGRTTSGGVPGIPVPYVPVAVSMSGPTTMAIEFNAFPAPGFLPDETCYTITLPAAALAQGLLGDADVMIRALAGDTTGSGDVTLSDAIATQARFGAALSGDARFDVDLSGTIDNADALAAKALVSSPGRQALCP